MQKHKHARTFKSDTQGSEQQGNNQPSPETNALEQQPAVEWGERLNSGKAIARGGKSTGFVAAAMPQTRKRST